MLAKIYPEILWTLIGLALISVALLIYLHRR
jgi:hypothetical protein